MQAREVPEKHAKWLSGFGAENQDLPVQKVLVTPAADIATEAYVGVIVDRASKRAVFMVRPGRGIDIEEVARENAGEASEHALDPRYGLRGYEALQLGFFLYDDVNQARAAAKIMQHSTGIREQRRLAGLDQPLVTPHLVR